MALNIPQVMQEAVAHHEAGRLSEAEKIYRQVLAEQPNYADALHLLGVIASQTRHYDVAIKLISQAIRADPVQSAFYANLGVALAENKQPREAMRAYRRAIELNPDYPQAHNNLGNVLFGLGLNEEAATCIDRALALRPDYAEAHFNLAKVQESLGHRERAVELYRRGLRLRPAWREGENNLANVLCSLGRFDEAAEVFKGALARLPENPLAHWNVALMHLRKGDFKSGLPEYEWRHRVPELGLAPFNDAAPLWVGGDLMGRRILLHAEQGLGDTIQFIRYVPLVAARGGKVIVAVQRDLIDLLRQVDSAAEWVAMDQPMPEHDVHCPLPSLMLAMGTELASVPRAARYLSADPALKGKWQARLATETRRKVGLVWAGGPKHPHDKLRSMQLEQLAALAHDRVALFSLQKGDAARQVASAQVPLTDWSGELNTWSDTAALVACMDIVVTVDTAVAHLAGAMGKPVWMLLPFVPDWRWMLGRGDSPWYPTMRLFRQRRTADWTEPVAELAEALHQP
jgi:Tfp pilus assembly protein PilF